MMSRSTLACARCWLVKMDIQAVVVIAQQAIMATIQTRLAPSFKLTDTDVLCSDERALLFELVMDLLAVCFATRE